MATHQKNKIKIQKLSTKKTTLWRYQKGFQKINLIRLKDIKRSVKNTIEFVYCFINKNINFLKNIIEMITLRKRQKEKVKRPMIHHPAYQYTHFLSPRKEKKRAETPILMKS